MFVIYSAGSYGEFGHESFLEAVGEREKKTNDSLCVVEKEKIKPGYLFLFFPPIFKDIDFW